MNYKQCEEFLEQNRSNEDICSSQLGILRSKLIEHLGLGKTLQERSVSGQAGMIALCFDDTLSHAWAMLFLEKALKEAGIKTICFSEMALGDYRNRWKIAGKSLSQKSLCEMIECMNEVLELMKDSGETTVSIPSIKQIELLVAEMVLYQSDAMVLLYSKRFQDLPKMEGVFYFEVPDDQEASYKITKQTQKKQFLDYKDWKGIQLASLGKEALLGACQVVDLQPFWLKHGWKVEERHLRAAFEDNYLAAGCGVASAKPLILLDCVWDVKDAQRLTEDIKQYLPDKQVILILGATKQTKVEEILPILCPQISYILTVAPPRVDRIPSYELAQEVLKVSSYVTAVDSLEEAFEIVRMVLPKDGVVITVGCQELLNRVIQIVNK